MFSSSSIICEKQKKHWLLRCRSFTSSPCQYVNKETFTQIAAQGFWSNFQRKFWPLLATTDCHSHGHHSLTGTKVLGNVTSTKERTVFNNLSHTHITQTSLHFPCVFPLFHPDETFVTQEIFYYAESNSHKGFLLPSCVFSFRLYFL